MIYHTSHTYDPLFCYHAFSSCVRLIFFEEKIKELEEAKVKVDAKRKKEKPILERLRAYKGIDSLLLEALVEKLEEGRPEKMVEYLKLRKEIKDKHPLED